MPKLQVFLSYSSTDSELAGNIKTALERFGLDVFLAHDDIEPSKEWQKRIIRQLKIAGVFLPVLTENYQDSNWTDQESGMAIAARAFILPLRITALPYGFIAKYQALKFDPRDLPSSCANIAKSIHANPKLKKAFLDGLIQAFKESKSFEDAKIISKFR